MKLLRELLQEKLVFNEAFLQSWRFFYVQLYTRKATQKAIITNPIFEGVIFRCTVLVRMICEIYIQSLEQLMMKFSCFPAGGIQLKIQNPGASTEAMIKLCKVS